MGGFVNKIGKSFAYPEEFYYNYTMFRIWAKVIVGEKIVKQLTYERDDAFTYSKFFVYLSDICEGLDIETPILMKAHIFNYAKFRTVRFLPRDFAEKPEFDKLVLDNITL